MHEIKCPKCGTVFTVDETGYAEILNQIRTNEFDKELAERIHQHDLQKQTEMQMVKLQADQEKEKSLAELQKQIEAMKAQIAGADKDKEIAIINATAAVKEELVKKDQEISKLQSDKQIAVIEASNKAKDELVQKDQEIAKLQNDMKIADTQNKLQVESIKNEYESAIKTKDAEIAFYKDLKSRMSTKMIGETLEQHCETEFNRLRPTAFQNAYFEKDNEAVKEEDEKKATKGDYIFRDYVDGIETISIMFEMKNEADETEAKRTNEYHFDKLDKDRKKKKCEYAVLVSTLEPDSELYNAGIVDVSHRYEKMFVVRPQCFIPIITLLRNAANNNAAYKKQIAEYAQSNIDVKIFEQEVAEFKEKFGKNYNSAKKNFAEAIAGIDKTIKQLEGIKQSLTTSENQLRLANDKATEELTIKRLTRNAPSVAKMFADAADGNK